MKFIYEGLLTEREKVLCMDGLFPARKEISHWPGNDSPFEFRADTTTEMAFKLIESAKQEEFLRDIEIISNNHFDADGLISCYVILHPQDALAFKEELIDIARTGDFNDFTSEDAFKANVVIEKLIDESFSPIKNLIKDKNFNDLMQTSYLEGFKLLPDIVKNIDKYEKYWDDEFSFYLRSDKSFENQQSVFSNYADIRLTVVESDFKLDKTAKFKRAGYEIVLSVVKTQHGNLYELEYKDITWFDTDAGNKIERKNFEPLRKILQERETCVSGEWKIFGESPNTEWRYKLLFANENFNSVPSSLAIYEIEDIIFNFFQN